MSDHTPWVGPLAPKGGGGGAEFSKFRFKLPSGLLYVSFWLVLLPSAVTFELSAVFVSVCSVS